MARRHGVSVVFEWGSSEEHEREPFEPVPAHVPMSIPYPGGRGKGKERVHEHVIDGGESDGESDGMGRNGVIVIDLC